MFSVMVIDDEYIVVRGIEAIIKRENLNCEVVGAAHDGLTALSLLEEIRPEIVITDIRIPKIDGLLLIEKAKELLPDSYFIVISGFKEFEYAKRALSMGVKSYIEKPVTIDKLKEAIELIEEEALTKKAHMMAENQGLRRQELDNRIDQMIQNILVGNPDQVKKLFEDYMVIIKAYFPDIGHFRRECLQVLCILCEFYVEKEKGDQWHSGISFEAMSAMTKFSEIETYAFMILNKIIGNMETQNYSANHKDIRMLLEYIGSHYDQDIGLDSLAEMVQLNPAYLSNLFKKEVGTSFIKYLTNLRIKKAKEYLLKDYRVVDVSHMVGYNNYRHFCDIFKRYVGQSPKEFRSTTRTRAI